MIRERRAEDDAAVAQVIREVAPGWVTTEAGARHRRLTAPARARRRDWVDERDGEVVAYASIGLKTDGDRDDVAWLNVFVRPAWRGRGIGAALYEELSAYALELGANRLLADGPATEATRGFAAGRGFGHTHTTRFSRLDPRSVDREELVRLAAEKEHEGYTLTPFSTFDKAPELVHAVDAEASLDEPADEPITDWPFQEWLVGNWQQPDLSHDGSFCVVHEGRPVALAEVRVDLESGVAANGFTATFRAHRGRGLARLAKLASIAWLGERGVTSLVTGNDETNAAMLAVNARLGYQPFTTWLAYVKDVEAR